MKRIVKYVAIDPFYSDFTQTYIGMTWDDIDTQQYEFEEYLGRYHENGIKSIYKPELIFER